VRFWASSIAALLLVSCSHEPPPETREAGRLGRIELYRAQAEGPPSDLVYLFSGADGTSRALRSAARELAEDDTAVVLVDLPSYLHGLAQSDDGCHYVIAELEELAHQLEREFGFVGYRSPVLAGVGAGGTLAYAGLAQSPAATIGGAVAVDPARSLGTRVPLCEGAKVTKLPGGGFAYAEKSDLPGRLRTAESSGGSPAARLVDELEPLLGGEGPEGAVAGALPDLPLIDIPADEPKKLFAVIWSGDGGWRDLDKTIGEILAQRGVPVVGVDCLRYFWHERQPDQVAADLARIMKTAREAWDTPDAIVIGYSLGADVLTFAVNRLDAVERKRVTLLSLLGLSSNASFEIEVAGWLGQVDRDAPATLPELQRFDLSRVQCFYGEEEEDVVCTAPELARAEIVRRPGGHHFDGNYEAIADAILKGAQRRERR
jgi:type IV secretory pathway VirJ component